MRRSIAPRAAGKTRPQAVRASAPIFWRSVHWATVLLLGAGGLGLICHSLLSAPGETAHGQFLLGFSLLGGAAGLAQGLGNWTEVFGRRLAGITRRQFVAFTIMIGLALASLMYWCGMRQFGGYDHSGIIEAGWRLVQGQRPYKDFPCTLPPAFILGAGYAFKLFGVSWRALILFTVLFSVGTFFWLVWLGVRLFADRALALVLALTVQSLSTLLLSYWWYNPITSVSAAVFLLTAALLWHHPSDWRSRVSYLAALALLATMKPNMAGGCIIAVTIVFLCSKQHRWRALFLSGCAFALFMVFLWINHLTLLNVLKGYLSVRQYGASATEVTELIERMSAGERWLSGLATVGALLPAVFAIWKRRGRFLTGGQWIGLGGIVATIHPFLVNGEFKVVDLVPALIGSILVASELYESQTHTQPARESGAERTRLGRSNVRIGKKRTVAGVSGSSTADPEHPRTVLRADTAVRAPVFGGPMRRLVFGLLLVLGFTGTGLAIARDRVKSIGYREFFEYAMPGAVPDGFFKGLHAGPSFRETLEQVQRVLKATPQASVFFGPRMEWGYAAFKLPSPLGHPIMWAPGSFFATSETGAHFVSFLQRRFDLLVFVRSWDGMGYYPPPIYEELRLNYICDESYSQLMVGRRALSPLAADSPETGKWADILVPSLKHIWKTELHLERGEMAEAVAELQEAIRTGAASAVTLRDLAWIRATAVEPQYRNAAQAVLLAEQGCKETQYKDAVHLRTLAAAYAEAGRFDEAVAMADKARTLVQAAGDKERLAKYEGLMRIFQAHTPFRDIKVPVAKHCRLAEEHLQRDELPAAVTELKAALDLDPQSPMALNYLAWVRATASQPELRDGAEAAQLAELACKQTEYQHPTLVRTLSVAYAETGRFDDAVATAARGRELALATADLELAAKLEELMRLFQAHVRFRDRPAAVQAHCSLADKHIRQGEMLEAAAELQEALHLDGEEQLVLHNLAWIRATGAVPELRNGAQAVQLAERACKLTQYQDAASVGTLAAAYAEAGRFDEAVAMAAKAIDLALAAGDKDLAATNQAAMQLFKAHVPYRDESTRPGGQVKKPGA
ncbi:MAG: hypothetical protein C5B50_07205 [Verrucomicrobia bacterium]|nr:MAG: hypothetical protein C5B50_07205 [Verrucomicrobiota bacterium]